MTTYNQRGLLTVGGVEFSAYSGHGIGLNNPEMENIQDVGPIPRGEWEVIQWHDHYEDKGPCVAQLSPVEHDAHGRVGFLCHGDNSFGNHTASHGCIIAAHDARQVWRDSGDMTLTVD